MKRLITSILLFCFLGQAVGAVADTKDKQLTAIVQHIKQQIDISDTYTEFYGEESSNDMQQQWNLYWKSDEQELDIVTDEDGTILSYYLFRPDQSTHDYDEYTPSFPDKSLDEVQQAAEQFAKRVLKSNETVVFTEDTDRMIPFETESTDLYGTLYYNGVKSPSWVSMTIDSEDLTVLSYMRMDMQCVSGIPAAVPTVQQTTAEQALQDTMQMRLQYTTMGSAENHAALLYVPASYDSYYVDAQTGETVNYSQLLSHEENGMGDAGTSTSESDGKLTDAEQIGVDLLKEVLSQEELEQKLDDIAVLGLSSYALNEVNYRVDTEEASITCDMFFIKEKNDETTYKSVAVDAKTGKLLSLYTYYSEQGTETELSDAQQQTIQAFLAEYAPDTYPQTTLWESSPSWDGSIMQTYAREVNGYAFPEQYIMVGMHGSDGTIDSFSSFWDEDTTFESPDVLTTAAQAQQTYFGAHAVSLEYLEVPVSTRSYPAYQELGYSFVYEWKLAYQAELEQNCYGVSAKDNTLCVIGNQEPVTIQYHDIDVNQYPEIAKLAQYGVGYLSDTFEPQKNLTQKDFLVLLLSAQGETYEAGDADGLAYIYTRAYYYGMLTEAEYAPNQELTRAAMVKIMIDATGYGRTAGIAEIYRCRFADESSISQQYYGYVATAQGLGLVKGDENGVFHPNAIATRAQAAILLYNFMSK